MLVSAFGKFVNVIANLFLQAKHWQIFPLLVVSPTIAEVAAPERLNDFGAGGFVLFAVTVPIFPLLSCVVSVDGSFLSVDGNAGTAYAHAVLSFLFGLPGCLHTYIFLPRNPGGRHRATARRVHGLSFLSAVFRV